MIPTTNDRDMNIDTTLLQEQLDGLGRIRDSLTLDPASASRSQLPARQGNRDGDVSLLEGVINLLEHILFTHDDPTNYAIENVDETD